MASVLSFFSFKSCRETNQCTLSRTDPLHIQTLPTEHFHNYTWLYWTSCIQCHWMHISHSGNVLFARVPLEDHIFHILHSVTKSALTGDMTTTLPSSARTMPLRLLSSFKKKVTLSPRTRVPAGSCRGFGDSWGFGSLGRTLVKGAKTPQFLLQVKCLSLPNFPSYNPFPLSFPCRKRNMNNHL